MKQRLVVIAALFFISSILGRASVAQSFPLTQLSTQPARERKNQANLSLVVSNSAKGKQAISAPQTPSICVRNLTANGDSNASGSGAQPYDFKRKWFPLWGVGCGESAAKAFFATGSPISGGNQAKFLYNPVQSTNQINADLLTFTLPGTEFVFSGTGSTSTNQASSNSSSSTSTQSVSTAVSKLLQGGDFNFRAPLPLFQYIKGQALDVRLVPNLGVSINTNTSGSTTSTPTEFKATNTAGNLPIEVTYLSPLWAPIKAKQNLSFSGYVNFEESGEILGSQLATTIGTPRVFALTQLAFGINISKKFKVGGQYFYGPQQAFCTVTTTGCTAAKGTVSGIHLDVGAIK